MERDLFFEENEKRRARLAPLAARMRPRTIGEYAGQEHLIGNGKPLRNMIEKDRLSNMILWGPPGTGKTSLAFVISHTTASEFVTFNATTEGVPRIRQIAEHAEARLAHGRRTVVMVDEVHRLSASQQDSLLSYVESGTFTIMGLTTENPLFRLNGALLSRATVYKLAPLRSYDIRRVVLRALKDEERGLGREGLAIEEDALSTLIMLSDCDMRRALSILETAATFAQAGVITKEIVEDVSGGRQVRYDKDSDRHDLISAFQKSIRSSQPDAALYYLARMVQGGEDPLHILRRMEVIAAEDVSLADPMALLVATAATTAFQRTGEPEGWLAVAEAVVYLATAPKSNRAYAAWSAAQRAAQQFPDAEIPAHVRNTPEPKGVGTSRPEAYQSPFLLEDHVGRVPCLPKVLEDSIFYQPSKCGYEEKVGNRMQKVADVRGF